MADQAAHSQAGSRVEREQLKRLEILSILEASTLVLLVCVAVPLKHAFGWPTGARILGPIHGIAFLAYSWTAFQTVAGGGWQGRHMVRLFAVAFLPFAGFFNIPWLRQRAGALNGGLAE